MSLSALSLTVALPAAAGLAQSAVQAGGQLGSGFLNMLSGLATPDAKDAPAPPVDAGGTPSASKPSSASKIQSWSEKLMSWLGKHRSVGSAAAEDMEVELSLDALDQPHVSVNGQSAAAIDAALVEDPTWLQEFRELALDRSAELGGPPGGALSAPPLSLKIAQRDGQVQAAWQ